MNRSLSSLVDCAAMSSCSGRSSTLSTSGMSSCTATGQDTYPSILRLALGEIKTCRDVITLP